jgi:glycerophosphoryl diester phosphodiesterase
MQTLVPTRPVTSARTAAGVLNIAHRGASGMAPEHTRAAAVLARQQGADYLELDVRATADGTLVVLHDATLRRTARGHDSETSDLVRDSTIEQLRRLDVGSWFNETCPERASDSFVGLGIQTLDDVFRTWGREWRYYIELKDADEAPAMEVELLRLMRQHRLRDGAATAGQVLIQSFSETSLRRIKALDPELPLIQLLPRLGAAGVRASVRGASGYAVGLGPVHHDVDAAVIAEAHGLALDVHPYTVNDTYDMRRLIALGVDGIFTDHPGRLGEVIEATAAGGARKWSAPDQRRAA